MGCRLVLPEVVPGFSMFFGTSTVGRSRRTRWFRVNLGNFPKTKHFARGNCLVFQETSILQGHESFVLGGVVTLDALRDQLISINIGGWKMDPE